MVELDRLADRHSRLQQRYASVFGTQNPDAGVVIVADPTYIRSFSGQVTWATLLNLTARLYKGIRHIRMVINGDVARLGHVFFPNRFMNLRQASLRLLGDINASSAFTIEEGVPRDDGREWIWVYVGARDPRYPPGIAVAGQGWLAFVNDDTWRDLAASANAVGPMVAACFGTAEIYKALYPLRNGRRISRVVFSAFDYSSDLVSNPDFPDNLELPLTYVAGAGAVGMAFLMLLDSTAAIRSSLGLHVAENDWLDDTNMNRCAIATIEDIDSLKTDIVRRRLDSSRLGLQLHDNTWQRFLQTSEHADERRFERVVSCVDKYAARRAVQYDRLPRTLFSAGTGDFLLTVSRHALNDGLSCGLCYQARDAQPGCAIASDGAQSAFEVPIDPSISFVSVLAGVLLGAEYLKDIAPSLFSGCVRNTVRVQSLTGQARSTARPKDAGCNCSSKYAEIGYRAMWARAPAKPATASV
jgi:hypothetical protein